MGWEEGSGDDIKRAITRELEEKDDGLMRIDIP
jgi:hypothetical protein